MEISGEVHDVALVAGEEIGQHQKSSSPKYRPQISRRGSHAIVVAMPPSPSDETHLAGLPCQS